MQQEAMAQSAPQGAQAAGGNPQAMANQAMANQAMAAQGMAGGQAVNPQIQQAAQLGLALMQNPVQTIIQILQQNPEIAQQIMSMAGVIPQQQAMQQISEVKAKYLIEQLDRIFPDWRNYQAEIAKALEMAPMLADDPKKLLKVALPDEVFLGQVVQQVNENLTSKAKEAQAMLAPATNAQSASSSSDVEVAQRYGVIS